MESLKYTCPECGAFGAVEFEMLPEGVDEFGVCAKCSRSFTRTGSGYLTMVRCVSIHEEERAPKEEAVKNGAYVENPEHYNQYRIDPYFFLVANNVPFAEGNVIKYVLRWRRKNGIEDLKKARRCIDLLIEAEERGLPEIKPER